MSTEFATLAPLEPLMDKCVHCGFCLATCPSYLLLGQEMASPRGRIYLMRAGVEGRVGMSATFAGHFDTCLGCMACETACPSGVRYAPLVEHTRAAIEHHHERPASRSAVPCRAVSPSCPIPRGCGSWRCRSPPPTSFAVSRGLTALLPLRLRNLLALAPDAPSGRAEVAELTRRRAAPGGCASAW